MVKAENTKRYLLPVLAFALLSALVFIGLSQAGNAVELLYSTSVSEVAPDESFEVSLTINPNTNDVLGADVTVKYDPSKLLLESYNENGSPFAFGSDIASDSTLGTVRLAKITMTPFTDPMPVLNLHFKAVGSGTTTLSFGDSLQISGVVSGEATEFSHTTTNKNIEITYPADTTPPPIPEGLTITGKSDSTISFSWDAVADNAGSKLLGYKPVYRQVGATDFTSVLTGGSGEITSDTSAIVSGLTGATDYEVAVRSVDNALNESLLTPPISVKTNSVPDTTAPSAPASLQVPSKTQNEITLSWSASTDGDSGIARYMVYRKATGENNAVAIASDVNALTYTDNNLASSSTYEYYIVAQDEAGNTSTKSNVLSVLTEPAVSSTLSDVNFYYQSGASAVEVNDFFTATARLNPNGNAVLGFDVSFKYDPSKLQLLNFDTAGSPFGTFGDINHNASTGTVRIYRILPSVSSAISDDQLVLNLNFKALKSNTSATLSYSGNLEVDGVNNNQAVQFPVKTTDFTISLIDPPVVADTQSPTAPSSLVATSISTSRIDLKWSASSDNIGVYKYDIYRKVPGKNFVKIYELAGQATTFGNTGLSASSTYEYTVYASDAAGNRSVASNIASATTKAVLVPTPPSPTPPPVNTNPPITILPPNPAPMPDPPPSDTGSDEQVPEASDLLIGNVNLKQSSLRGAIVEVTNPKIVSARALYGLSASGLFQSTNEFKREDGQDNLTVVLNRLTPGTTYFYQIVATSDDGTVHEGVIEQMHTRGYRIMFRLQDNKGNPLRRVLCRLFSVETQATTDDEGVVYFDDVAPGNHEIAFEYNGVQVRQSITVNDVLSESVEYVAADIEPQVFALNVDVPEPTSKTRLVVSVAILVAILLAIIRGIIYIRRQSSRARNTEQQPPQVVNPTQFPQA
jgi:chitodextrinase